jgi:hypothetical protein
MKEQGHKGCRHDKTIACVKGIQPDLEFNR